MPAASPNVPADSALPGGIDHTGTQSHLDSAFCAFEGTQTNRSAPPFSTGKRFILCFTFLANVALISGAKFSCKCSLCWDRMAFKTQGYFFPGEAEADFNWRGADSKIRACCNYC